MWRLFRWFLPWVSYVVLFFDIYPMWCRSFSVFLCVCTTHSLIWVKILLRSGIRKGLRKIYNVFICCLENILCFTALDWSLFSLEKYIGSLSCFEVFDVFRVTFNYNCFSCSNFYISSYFIYLFVNEVWFSLHNKFPLDIETCHIGFQSYAICCLTNGFSFS